MASVAGALALCAIVALSEFGDEGSSQIVQESKAPPKAWDPVYDDTDNKQIERAVHRADLADGAASTTAEDDGIKLADHDAHTIDKEEQVTEKHIQKVQETKERHTKKLHQDFLR